jgi:hypothetical protein
VDGEADAEREAVPAEAESRFPVAIVEIAAYVGPRSAQRPATALPDRKDGDGAAVGSEGRGGVDSSPASESPRPGFWSRLRGVVAFDGREEGRGRQDSHPGGRD